ncbi:unnamed protein product, partial [Polarella glacialis]
MAGHSQPMLIFDVECPAAAGSVLVVCGTGPLGGWDSSKALELEKFTFAGSYRWRGSIFCHQPIEFKYALITRRQRCFGLESLCGGSFPKTPPLVKWEGDFARTADPEGSQLRLRHRFGVPEALALEDLHVTASVRLTRCVSKSSPHKFGSKYMLLPGQVLGHGMNGDVVTAETIATGQQVAVKTLRITGDRQNKLARVEIEN